MKTLDFCYEHNFSKIDIKPRKQKITHPKTILYGSKGVGKTYLIYDFLLNYETKDYLYIDFNDNRNDKKEIEENLENFIVANHIKILILENYEFDFKLPLCDNIIITTYKKKELNGFKIVQVNPLDFEEYILYENKYQQATNSFNNFLKYGNLPHTIELEEHKKVISLQKLIKDQSLNNTEYQILKLLIENIDEKKSFYELFNRLKNSIKISKDIFYNTCKKFQEEKKIYFVQKYSQNRATKKIYSYNHAFFSAVTHDKKFKNEFSNMIFLELAKKYENIYYLDHIDFYIKNRKKAIISIPFFNTILMSSALKKILKTANEFDIKYIDIITVSNSENIKNENITIKAIPFYEWALL